MISTSIRTPKKPRRRARAAQPCTLPTFAPIASFTPRDRCGTFMDALRQRLRTHPAYLSPRDCDRHLTMLEWFTSRTIRDFPPMQRAIQAEAIPVRFLRDALRYWLVDAIYYTNDILLPSFVLDTAQMIMAHAEGAYVLHQSGTLAKLEGAVAEWEDRGLEVADQSIKRTITESHFGLIVQVQIPDGVHYRHYVASGENIQSGQTITVALRRCHLSSGRRDDVVDFELVGRQAPEYDLAGDFLFPARIVPDSFIREVQARTATRECFERQGLLVPGAWITAHLSRKSFEWVPAPYVPEAVASDDELPAAA